MSLLHFVYFLIVTLVYFFAHRWSNRMVLGSGAASRSVPARVQYVKKTVSIALTLLYLAVVSLVLGINYGEITIFLSSAFAVIGVALFAQWSILSNITASLVIFFGFPYRIGDRVKVLDKDDTLSGVIEEISLFSVQLRDSEGNLATFPNSLFLQRPVIKIESKHSKAVVEFED